VNVAKLWNPSGAPRRSCAPRYANFPGRCGCISRPRSGGAFTKSFCTWPTEASAYIFCRHFIAEPGIAPVEFDAARWADSLGYFHQSTREALEIIRRLRRMTYQLLITVPEPVWSHSIAHSKSGEISLEKWVELQEQHIPHHVAQMRENYLAWLERNPPRKSVAPPHSQTPRSFLATAC